MVSTAEILAVQIWEIIVLVYCAQLIRLCVPRLPFSTYSQRVIRTYLFGMEMCTCYVATSVFYNTGGPIAFFISRCLLNWTWYLIGSDTVVDVCVFIENYVRRTSTLLEVAIDTVVTYLGFKSAWKILHIICLMTHSTDFEAHCEIVESCTTDLKVSCLWGMLIEFMGTFLCRLYSLWAEFNPSVHDFMFMTFFNNFVNCFALPFTGSYCNPILAFVLLHHCKGHDKQDFYLVYFVSPVLGSLIALCCVLYSERLKRNTAIAPSSPQSPGHVISPSPPKNQAPPRHEQEDYRSYAKPTQNPSKPLLRRYPPDTDESDTARKRHGPT